jgi:hypothetical protein
VTDPPDGLPIRSSDLLLAAFSVQQFEEERDLMRRPAANTGATPRYEWDAMYAWLTWFVFEKGVPETQTALVSLVQDPPVSGKLSAALLFLYLSGGRDRTMTWDIHQNENRLC